MTDTVTIPGEQLQHMVNAIDMLIPTLGGLRDSGNRWLRKEIIESKDALRAALDATCQDSRQVQTAAEWVRCAAHGAQHDVREIIADMQTAPVQEPCAELIDYILQADIHNRLTPRVVDIAYSAWSLGRSGKNMDDGGPCDWFNGTKPMVMTQLAKIKKDLAEEAQPRKAVKLSDEEISTIAISNPPNVHIYARAIEQAVLKANGVEP